MKKRFCWSGVWLREGCRGGLSLLLVGALGACTVAPVKEGATAEDGAPKASAKSVDVAKKFASADEIMVRAEKTIAAGQPGDAIKLYEQAAKEAPTYKTPWMKLARLYYDKGNFLKAYQAASEAYSRDPMDADARALKAMSALQLASSSVSDWVTAGQAVPADKDNAALLTKAMNDMVAPPPPPKPVAKKTHSRYRHKTATKAKAAPSSPSADAPQKAPSGAGGNPFASLK